MFYLKLNVEVVHNASIVITNQARFMHESFKYDKRWEGEETKLRSKDSRT